MEGGGGGEIPITALTVENLGALREQIEEELQGLTESYNKLREAATKFTESKTILGVFGAQSATNELLVPITPSMYVRGTLEDVATVMVDIGTGYYLEKPVPDAVAYMDRKVQLIQDNVDKVAQVIAVKQKNHEQVVGVLRQKMAAAGAPHSARAAK